MIVQLVPTTPLYFWWQMRVVPLNSSLGASDGQASSLNLTRGRTHICKAAFDGEAHCRGRKMEQNSQDKGRGRGRYTSARWHRLLCNWAPKLFIHRPPCPPFFLPKLHCYWSGLLYGGKALGCVFAPGFIWFGFLVSHCSMLGLSRWLLLLNDMLSQK